MQKTDSSKIKKVLPLEDSPHLLDLHGPVFLLGSPRSGTTFLSSVVTSANDVEEFVGILAPSRLMHLLAKLEKSKSDHCKSITTCIRDVFWHAFIKRRTWRTERFVKLLKGKISLIGLFKPLSVKNSLFTYKEPLMCLAASVFAKEFNSSKFVHIIRDGRDVAASFLRRYPDALSDHVLLDQELASRKNSEIGSFRLYSKWVIPWWVESGREDEFVHASKFCRCLWLWRILLEHALELRDNLPADRYLEVFYEELTISSRDVGEKILRFIGKESNACFNRQMRKAYITSIGSYKKYVSRGEVTEDEINAVAGCMLRRLNYI